MAVGFRVLGRRPLEGFELGVSGALQGFGLGPSELNESCALSGLW